jgi:hypothetical protein
VDWIQLVRDRAQQQVIGITIMNLMIPKMAWKVLAKEATSPSAYQKGTYSVRYLKFEYLFFKFDGN